MPTVPIPLFTKVYKNVDESVLTEDAALQYNGFIDEKGGVNGRPGEVLAVNATRRIDGIFAWPETDLILSAEENKAVIRSISGETLTTLYTSSLTFAPGNPVMFASDGFSVFMAGGGKLNYIGATGTLTELGDADAPTTVTHVIYLDGYIIAIDGTNKFFWSDANLGGTWQALSFASAEANPDVIKAMHIVQRQIYFLGTVTTEIWENDGSSPFSRIPGGLIEVGCGAAYSVVRHDNSLMWLSHTRQFVRFSGLDVEFISSPYDKEIANFVVVSDCIGGFFHKDGQEFCLFTFPSEGRTLVYNPTLKDWSEWSRWDSSGMRWLPYDFRCSARDIRTGKTFVGKGTAKVISCLSSDSRVDVTGASTTESVKYLRRTGWIDNGMSKKKRLEELRFRAKRGTTDSTSAAVLMIRYRKNGTNNWSNLREINLGAVGQTNHHVKLKRLGIYESIQFEISVTDDTAVVLSGAEADITVLR